MNHELKHILRHHVQINLVVRGLTDRFCNHIEKRGDCKRLDKCHLPKVVDLLWTSLQLRIVEDGKFLDQKMF